MDLSKGSGRGESLSLRAPLVGRDAELAKLEAFLLDRSERRARTVTVLGAGGIGKTRLLDEVLARVADVGLKGPRIYRSSARTASRGFGVFARLLRARFGLAEGTPSEDAKAQVRDQVSNVLDDRRVSDVCFFLGQMMDLRFFDSPLTKAVAQDAAQAAHLGRAIVKSFFEADATHTPLGLVIDDLHLADDDSLSLLGYLMEQVEAPLAVLATARNEIVSRREGWFEVAAERHQRMDLGSVDEGAARGIARALLAPCNGGPPDRLVDAAVSSAEGNPGLLEQMVRVYHDAQVLQAADTINPGAGWKVNLGRLVGVELPLSIDAAVEARTGALPPRERRILEWAAVMGSVFWRGGLLAIERHEAAPPEFWRPFGDEAEVDAALEELCVRGHVLKLPDSTFPGDVEFVFKHNLEREKILVLISATASRRYHQAIADWLGGMSTLDAEEEYFAMLGEHLQAAGGQTRAGRAYLDAGDSARAHFRSRRAEEYYQRGLELLGEDDPRRRIDALHNRGDVLLVLGKRDEALAAFREMLSVAYRVGSLSAGGAAHGRIGRLHRGAGALSDARPHFTTALELYTAVHDERGIASSRDDMGQLHWMKGEYELALEELKAALEMRRAQGDRRNIALSLANLGRVMLDHGQPAEARAALESALAMRRELGDPLDIVSSLTDLGRLAQDQADHRLALSLFREAYAIVEEVGERTRMASVMTLIGETYHRLGDVEQAVKVLTDAEHLCDELGDRLHLGEAKRGLAKVFLKQGDLRKARDSVKLAMDIFGQVKSKPHLASVLRTCGEITAAGAWGESHRPKAADYFMRSIQLCKEIGNELEIAKSYRAFARYVQCSEDWRDNEEIQTKATRLAAMAEEIFARRRSALGVR
ncbi:MAG: tetratricopeptide repeat protein [Polyangiaceae bacterium]|nr:tetratricopeptide repeat protein [Polyangiaceae bacterium]